ncbi:MAG: hypothetical protein Q8K82_13580 [Gemmatimonadaceae bacterium]|nr:hypothetical protein [Gemmatimonadaceae bacterium]
MTATPCPVCRYPVIPGITSCVQCGEPTDRASLVPVEIEWPATCISSPEEIAAMIKQNAQAVKHARAITEARSLEYAGDLGGAMAIYERMLAAGTTDSQPYRRLAIRYAKAKRPDDEERVVRAALGRLHPGAHRWFVLRLAKLLAAARKRADR